MRVSRHSACVSSSTTPPSPSSPMLLNGPYLSPRNLQNSQLFQSFHHHLWTQTWSLCTMR
uniref:Ankyrin repeat and MYND domain containing 1 n=2 Tax=Pan TaxID=9596 RepID=G2HEN6_PANTR|nr:ankyrin repeat and MYND domain-containing protein 1 [Pan troglodytes]